ncbi:unnamed protein product [Brugia pahangi]|uniref:TNFR-Cys domain-containing protein n=1 Tax=Brugia pahangi TaxID=6280 RepID=A0A0N4T2A7_BRUPA|nr:unnamed protein product [Brugia pahangi]
MWQRSVLFLFSANILLFTFELGINQMDFCCSSTCCCSLCTAEQCQLADQPGYIFNVLNSCVLPIDLKQCRCYNTTNITCWRFRNSIYKSEHIELPEKMQIFSVLPEQPVMAQVVPVGSITGMDIDPLCCVVGNCPVWIKCKHSLNIRRDQSALQSMPVPLFIVACILFVLIIITTIGLCIAASLYINDSYKHKRRNYSATMCYVGRNFNYISRSCEGGGSSSKEFVCQKFICEGGKSPFVLRTCANKRLGCLAGPAICRFSGGTGSCVRCDKNNCNL